MKTQFIYILALGALPFFAAEVYGQEVNRDSTQAKEQIQRRIDSLSIEQQKAEAEARKTQELNQQATQAAKASKKAVKTAKKAQKIQEQAEEQERKAAKAKEDADKANEDYKK